MNIFDIHVHIFPDAIAEKASRATGRFYGLDMEYDGKLSTAIAALDDAGIRRFAAHSVASTPHQAESINRFVLESHKAYPDRLIPFAAMHPAQEHVADFADGIVNAGFYGVKLHPDIQNFQLDSPAAMELFAALEGRLPVIIHTGDVRYDNSGPVRMRRVLDAFPRLTCICAHLGGYSEWDDALRLLADTNCYVDTSSALFALPPERAREIIRSYGADRVLFGTDYPMWNMKRELGRFLSLELTDAENERILHRNAEELLHLPAVD